MTGSDLVPKPLYGYFDVAVSNRDLRWANLMEVRAVHPHVSSSPSPAEHGSHRNRGSGLIKPVILGSNQRHLRFRGIRVPYTPNTFFSETRQ
jgi:hypothetical protein